MAPSHHYTSSADLYPPVRHQYDPITYPAASASVDYLGDATGPNSRSASQHNLAQHSGPMSGYGYSDAAGNNGASTPRLGAAGESSAFLSASQARYGEKYSDAEDGPPEAMLAHHNNNGRGRGYRDASSAGAGKGFFANKRKRNWIIAIILLLIAVIIAAVVGGVVASRNSSSSSSDSKGIAAGSNGSGSGSNSKDAIENSALTGGNGTQITMENGQTFTYINNFGGHWVSTPFDDSARPQSWSPALNESWDYTNMKYVHSFLTLACTFV